MPCLPVPRSALSIESFECRVQADAQACDLRPVTFVDAYGLVATGCALIAANADGHRVPVYYPRPAQVRRHLSRMGFRDFLAGLGYPSELPPNEAVDRSDVLVPLQRVDAVSAAEQLSHLLHEQLRSQADPQVLNAVLEGLWELSANALEHSGAQAVIMGQVYRRGVAPHHRNVVQVAIGDAGIGVRESFLRTGMREPATDRAAITDALEYLVTSVDDPGRGQGLYTTHESVTSLGGEMIVRSGTAKVRLGAHNTNVWEDVIPLPGTMVCVSLALNPGEAL